MSVAATRREWRRNGALEHRCSINWAQLERKPNLSKSERGRTASGDPPLGGRERQALRAT